MSSSILLLKQDAERNLSFARELAELCPDAYLAGERWFSPALPLSDCDSAELVLLPGTGRMKVLIGKLLPSGIVWRGWSITQDNLWPTLLVPTGHSGLLDERNQALLPAVLAFMKREIG